MGGILSQDEIDALFQTAGSGTLDDDQPAASSGTGVAAVGAAPAQSAVAVARAPQGHSNRTHYFLYCRVCGMTVGTYQSSDSVLICKYGHKIRQL